MASPLYLIALIPWAVIAVYIFFGKRTVSPVPFVDLWRNLAVPAASKRSMRLPPIAVIALLIAALVAILAAAGPEIRDASSVGDLIVVADRGITMSANERLSTLANSVSSEILQLVGPGSMTLCVVPGDQEIPADRADWPNLLPHYARTAANTKDSLTLEVRRALSNPAAIVLLLSDRKIEVSDPCLVQIAPMERLSNVAIAGLQVRATPSPQAMVRLLNESSLNTTNLTVSGANPIRVALPPMGTSRNYFVDLASAGQTVEASISPGGDIAADHHAWTIRHAIGPVLSAHVSLPPELQRIVDVYRRNRPPGSESDQVSIIDLQKAFPASPAAAVVTETTPTASIQAEKIESKSSPITDGIDWTAALNDAQAATTLPPAGFEPVVSADGKTLIAIQSAPVRQVWIGFRSTAWAATPDFVIWWTKVFDWLGNRIDRYESKTIGENETRLPGIYADGALNAPAVDLNQPDTSGWQSRLENLAANQQTSNRDMRGWFALAAIACLLIAAIKWPT
jgi:hypothetical protein